jgi:Peptidase family M48
LQLCLEAIKHGDNIDFVLGNFLQKMDHRGQLTETVDALRRVAPGLTIESFSFHLGNDNLGRLLYQGYFLLAATEPVPLADQRCKFGFHPPIPGGATARLDYVGTVSCKNDSWSGPKILVEYQERVWIANASGFHYVVAPADAPVRPLMDKTFEQAIARVNGGRGESDTPMDELALGLQARQGILAKQKPLNDPSAEAAGTRAFTMLMSTPIAMSGKVAGFDLTLLDDPSVNAFSTAGGHIYVDKGMLPVIGKDTGLWSAVIAHEAGHVVAHHQYKAYLRAMSLKATRDALQRQAAAGNKYAGWAYLFSLAGGHVLNMKLSRNDELEADRLGLMMMAQAGIHPDYAEILMQRLHRMTAARSPRSCFLTIHVGNKRKENSPRPRRSDVSV